MRTVKWNVTLSGLCGLAVALGVVASGARADVTSEKAVSILIFPKVQVDASFDTVIQIANTSNSLIHAHCNYVDARLFDTFTGAPCFRESATCLPNWQETDFTIWLTKQQPTHWLVSAGRLVDPTDGFGDDGSGFDPGRVPPMSPFDGELKCVEVTASGEPLLGNHLKGEAILTRISGPSSGDNSKYNAVGIEGNPSAVATNPLLLDGNIYNACPSELWLNHFAEFAPDPIAAAAAPTIAATINTELTLVPCSEDFENQLPKSVTVQFLVHNEFEELFSASTTVTCFLSVRLFDIDSPSLPTQSIFSENVLGTDVAMTEITPVVQTGGDSGAVIGIARRTISATSGQTTVTHSLVTTGDFIPPAGPDSIRLANPNE